MIAEAAQLLVMKSLTLLGSTGSIGTNTLAVVRQNRPLYGVYGLVAGHNTAVIIQQILEFRPKIAVLASSRGMDRVAAELSNYGLARPNWPELSFGPAAMVEAATAPEVDIVVSAIVGVAGLEATFEAGRRGKRGGLAKKKVVVSGGRRVMDAVRKAAPSCHPSIASTMVYTNVCGPAIA